MGWRIPKLGVWAWWCKGGRGREGEGGGREGGREGPKGQGERIANKLRVRVDRFVDGNYKNASKRVWMMMMIMQPKQV